MSHRSSQEKQRTSCKLAVCACVRACVRVFLDQYITTQLGMVKLNVKVPYRQPRKVSLRCPPPDRTDGWGSSK